MNGARGFSRAAVLVAVALLSQAQTGAPMTTIDKGAQSRVDEARQVVVRTAAEWERLWTAHADGRPRPDVDFARDMIVAVFLGSRPTAGYGVAIAGVRHGQGETVVEYRETRPGPGRMTAQVITSPYDIVAIPKVEGPVRFEAVKDEGGGGNGVKG